MTGSSRILVPLARTSETVLRRVSTPWAGRATVRLLTARIIGPCLTALERFLDARERTFRERGWV